MLKKPCQFLEEAGASCPTRSADLFLVGPEAPTPDQVEGRLYVSDAA